MRAAFKPIEPRAFRKARHAAGLTMKGCAALLRVCERTVSNWEAGRTAIPYSALRLLRIEAGQRLPGDVWRGWYLSGDYLCSANGHRFSQADLLWLSLVFARAEMFGVLYAQVSQLRRELERAGCPQPEAAAPEPLTRGGAGREAAVVGNRGPDNVLPLRTGTHS
jgi:transcriptional regulator with XRE-family HTH domain